MTDRQIQTDIRQIQTERQIQTDRQIHGQTDRYTDRQMQTDRQIQMEDAAAAALVTSHLHHPLAHGGRAAA